MKLQLAYNNELELPNLPTFRGRINYIKNNIFNNEDYIVNEESNKMTFEEYYNIGSLKGRNKIEEELIRNRWLGVKRIGSPFKDESMKLTIDFVTGYILNCKEYSVKHEIHMFKLLKKKQIRGDLNSKELTELEKLEKNVISYRFSEEDIVFFFNHSYENFIKRREKEVEDSKIKMSLQEQISSCKKLRSKAKVIDRKIKKIESQIADIEELIKEKYKSLKQNRDSEELFVEISNNIKLIRKLKKNIEYFEFDLKYLVDDYLQITELQISAQ